MILVLCCIVVIQLLLDKLNKKINYGYEYKYLPIILGISSVIFLKINAGISLIKLALCMLLINIALIDYKYMEIPDIYNAWVIILGIANIILSGQYQYFITGIISFIAFYLLSVISGGAVGGGDIKLALGLGLFFSISSYIDFVSYTFVTGAVISLLLLITKKKDRKSKIPFGPFMALGAVLSMF